MTLTVVVGSSGSGKTTFLNDAYEQHKCIYLHSNFDPTQLPYWDIYQREGTADTIKVGGTMAGEFTAGLSGGQRKLLLFELVRQRVMKTLSSSSSGDNKDDNDDDPLLIALDEPFAGVTDDFVPFIVERLNEMRQKHNIVLVTNDHIQVLKQMADNTLTVSAIDRTMVRINDHHAVDRRKALLALSVGDRFVYQTGAADVKFFFQVEIFANAALIGIAFFVLFLFGMILLTFWDSEPTSAALILIAGEILSYFSLNPYLLSAVDWRNYMKEEAEALMHASVATNLLFRTLLTLVFGFLIWNLEFGIVNLVVSGLGNFDIWYGVMFDNLSTTLPFIIMGLYTSAPHQDVEMIGSLPFLLMLFLSTAYSPGAGVPFIKGFRYIFPKFYLWCTVPYVEDDMEGCPDTRTENRLYLALSSFTFTALFAVINLMATYKQKKQTKKRDKSNLELMDEDFLKLQIELYGAEKGQAYFTKMSERAQKLLRRNSSRVSNASQHSSD